MDSKGFTLLELVIVIGILAVLGVVSVLVLNPAQLFAQARDTTRIEDMSVVRNALALYVSTVSTPSIGDTTKCYSSANLSVATAGCQGAGATARHGTKPMATYTANRTVDGTGWIPVNLGSVPGGPALSVLPIDPTNNDTFFYSYAPGSGSTYELNAHMESDRYHATGPDDKESNTKDGGDNPNVYEVGTDAGLDL